MRAGMILGGRLRMRGRGAATLGPPEHLRQPRKSRRRRRRAAVGAWELKGRDGEDEELERKRPYSAFGGQKSLDQIIDSARRLASRERTKKGTWAICPGCWKEIGANDDADGRSRLAKHLADRSANEYLSGETDPEKIWHLTTSFWKQLMAIEKKLAREENRLRGR